MRRYVHLDLIGTDEQGLKEVLLSPIEAAIPWKVSGYSNGRRAAPAERQARWAIVRPKPRVHCRCADADTALVAGGPSVD